MSGMALSLDAEVLPKAVRDFQPEWGIVLGSGLGSLVHEVDAILSLPYEEISGMPVSSAPGHAGRFVFGRLAGCRVLMAQGRVHLYEGCTAEEVTATVRFMDSLGVCKLILTNAAGTLHPQFEPGSWMLLCDHLNLTGTSPLLGGANFVDMSAVYSPALRECFHAAALAENVTVHEGVYAGVLGPQYETPAEVRMLRALGADAVGMSTVLEAIQAHALKMEVAAFSCLTNWAAGLGNEPLSHAEVMATEPSRRRRHVAPPHPRARQQGRTGRRDAAAKCQALTPQTKATRNANYSGVDRPRSEVGDFGTHLWWKLRSRRGWQSRPPDADSEGFLRLLENGGASIVLCMSTTLTIDPAGALFLPPELLAQAHASKAPLWKSMSPLIGSSSSRRRWSRKRGWWKRTACSFSRAEIL